jgi:hypothetical protein
MGANQFKNKLKKDDVSEECKKEYFKLIKKDFSEGIKKINSTIHKGNSNYSFSDDDWINFLLDKFTEYLEQNNLNNKYIKQILFYLQNIEESNETKHVYNLSIYLAKEIEDMNLKKQSIKLLI